MVKCSIKGCNKQAKVFLKRLRFCEDHAREIGLGEKETGILKEQHNDFLMFKRTHFQVRDEAITEEAYLHFLAGYFGVIPTLEDLEVPEKGYFEIQKRSNPNE